MFSFDVRSASALVAGSAMVADGLKLIVVASHKASGRVARGDMLEMSRNRKRMTVFPCAVRRDSRLQNTEIAAAPEVCGYSLPTVRKQWLAAV